MVMVRIFESQRKMASILKDKVNPAALTAEIIIGKIANDTTNPTITAWLSGLYGPVEQEQSANIAVELLLPNRLKDQYCFRTQQAVNCLTLEEVYNYDV